jgi:hypothetical protein
VQVQAADVKGHFGAQHFEEAQDVVVGLGKGVGREVQSPVP